MSVFLSCLAATVIAVGLSGCGNPDASEQPAPDADQPEAGSGDEPASHEHGEDDHAGHMPGTEESEALAELSPEDRAAAEKQRICPVNNEVLGSMGKPFKVTHGEHELFLCCEDCKDKFMQDPSTYMAKLNQ